MIVPVRKAVAFLEKHDNRARDPIEYIEAEDLARLVREARVLLFGASADEQVDLRLFMAVAEARLGNLEESAAILRGVLAARPAELSVVNDLGAILHRLGRHEEALANFVEAQKFTGSNPASIAIATLNEVDCRIDLGDIDGALVAFERVERMAAPDSFVAVLMAVSAARLGREEDAVEYLARSCCLRAGVPRGEEPALDVIDRLPVRRADGADAPGSFVGSALRTLDRAVAVVRQRENDDAPPEMVPRARIQLDPAAWARFQQLVAE